MNLEDNKNIRLLIEAVIVGIITVVVGYIVTWIVSNFNKDAKDINKEWNKNHIMELVLFLTGVCIHLLCEVSGINSWYCENGLACQV
tara:strand:+ start:1051 stop:1311 length:261 start_codon:yes stop_codon:yes gene_type:complete